MSRLSDERLDALVPAEVFGWALGLGGMTEALRQYGRAVAEAAVQAEQEGREPVLEVVVEPDYVSRGHLWIGYRPWINPDDIRQLAIGTKLYTTPPAAPVPDGYVLIPLEPTPEMVQAGYDASWDGDVTDEQMFAAVYRAMLAAAKATPC